MDGHDVGAEIKNLVGEIERGNPDLSASARIKRAWNMTVDKRIQEHVTAVFVVPETGATEVIVYVDSSIWATELNMQSELLRLNLNLELNRVFSEYLRMEDDTEQVRSLSFQVSRDVYKAPNIKMTTFEQLEEQERRLSEIEPGVLSDEEKASLQEAAAHIENEELREAAYLAAKKNLEWQKGINRRKDTPC